MLIVDREIERMIDRGAPADEVTTSARKTGMKSLWESGLGHVIAGATSLHELLDNIAAPAVEGGESQADVDAILRQLLPTQRAAKPVTATAETPRVSPSLPMAADASGKARRILVVDDDREDRRAARGVLEQAGFQVIEAADGEAALNYIRRLRPDAIVTEIALPRLDAVGLLQSIQGPDTPVVLVLTRQTDSALMEWMRELGELMLLLILLLPAVLQASRNPRPQWRQVTGCGARHCGASSRDCSVLQSGHVPHAFVVSSAVLARRTNCQSP